MTHILPYLFPLGFQLASAMSMPALNTSRPQSNITWGPCAPELEALRSQLGEHPIHCANLTVPLDYTNLSSSQTHQLELIKIAASNSPFQGSVVTNFGGPGAEGLQNLINVASLYQNLTGGGYDLIGFNPRGTSQHFLRFSCYETEEERIMATTPNPLYTNFHSSDAAFGEQWATGKVVADTCAQRAKDVGPYISTAFTARDVMQIVDALNQGELVNYYGVSYGTGLGATLVAMFPDRMGKVVLDGVLNPHEYYHSFTDVEMNRDTDAAFSEFLSACITAGPDRCILAKHNLTASALESMTYSLINRVKFSPIPLQPSFIKYNPIFTASMIDYSSLKNLIQATLYHPPFFSLMANGLDSLLFPDNTNNLTSFVQWRDYYIEILSHALQDESLIGIRCSDKLSRTSNPSDLLPILNNAQDISKLGGDAFILSMFTTPCAQWRDDLGMAAKERYTGDFKVRTKTPVLLVGNKFDPVTPLSNAFNVSAGFEGSAVLSNNMHGHCSYATKSACSNRVIAEYFSKGRLPSPGTVCEPDKPFFSE